MRPAAAAVLAAYVLAVGAIAGWSAARAVDRRDQEAARLRDRLSAVEFRLMKPAEEVPTP